MQSWKMAPARSQARRARWWLWIAAFAFLGSCQGSPVGPTLDQLVLESVGLRPTSETATLCCCRVIGTATNLNSVPVHVTIKFSAYDGVQEEPIGSTLYFIRDLKPSEQHQIDAAGLIIPCDTIRELRREVDVNGIVFPDEEAITAIPFPR